MYSYSRVIYIPTFYQRRVKEKEGKKGEGEEEREEKGRISTNARGIIIVNFKNDELDRRGLLAHGESCLWWGVL